MSEYDAMKQQKSDILSRKRTALETELATERAKVADLRNEVQKFVDVANTNAAERNEAWVKVAELENEVHEWEESDKADVVLRPIVTEEREAEIRREVARECAEIAEKYRMAQLEKARQLATIMDDQSYACEARAQGAFMVRDAIRARFGVTE